MNKLDKKEYKSCANAQESARFFGNKHSNSRAEPIFESDLLDYFHSMRGAAFRKLYFEAERESRILTSLRFLLLEISRKLEQEDPEDESRYQALRDAVDDILELIAKMCTIRFLREGDLADDLQ
jgi:hypothetical protein